VIATTLDGVLSADPRVCGVLFATGRLSSLAGFEASVAAQLPVRTGLPGGAVLYTRAACQA
jgi:hypothetical protein